MSASTGRAAEREASPQTSWSFACPDWKERLAEGRSLVPDLPIDADAGERAVRAFDQLRLPDVQGQPLMAEAGADWFRDILRAAFGSICPETGRRRVGEIFVLVPKKNSKTTYTAALGLVSLMFNTRPNAELLIVGPTQDVAELCFAQAAGMIEADTSGLAKRFHVQVHLKKITYRPTGAALRIKSFDSKVMTGTKPVTVIVDELHELDKKHGADNVLRQIRGGFLPNPEGLLVFITTQSAEVPSGVFKKELTYARKVRDGQIPRGNLLPVLYEFPEEIQKGDGQPWRDPRLWPMVLPNLGRSIQLDTLIEDYEKAKEKGLDSLALWASQHLNIELGMGLHAERWIGADYWEDAARPELTLDDILETSDAVTIGIDGGGLDDLLGVALIGRHRETRQWRLWVQAIAHTDVFEKRKEIAQRLRDFEADGDLVVAYDPTDDIATVCEAVSVPFRARLMPAKHAIGLDPHGIGSIVDGLAAIGVPDDMMIAIPQGYKLSAAVWTMERKLKDGSLVHCGQPLMGWCVSNAKAEQRGNAVYISKQAAGKSKIDPLIAAFNAVALMSRNPVAQRRSIYNELGAEADA